MERIPCNILVAPGHSAYCSIPNYYDSSLQVSYVYHVQCNLSKTNQVNLNRYGNIIYSSPALIRPSILQLKSGLIRGVATL